MLKVGGKRQVLDRENRWDKVGAHLRESGENRKKLSPQKKEKTFKESGKKAKKSRLVWFPDPERWGAIGGLS